MLDQSRYINPNEKDIQKILQEARSAVEKMETDIIRLLKQGGLHLNYKSLGSPPTDAQHLKKEVQSLYDAKDYLKLDAYNKIETLTQNVSPVMQKEILSEVRNELKINAADVIKKAVEEKNKPSYTNEYFSNLKCSRFLQANDKPEKNMDSNFHKDTGEKEKG